MDKTADDIEKGRISASEAGNRGIPSGNPPIARIRAEIDRTRDETIRTINELERRLSPSRLKEQVKDRARQATVGRASAMAKQTGETSRKWGTVFFEALKQNPLPTMLVGGGLAWLIANGVRQEESTYGTIQAEEEFGFEDRRKSVGTDASGTYGMGFIDRRRSQPSQQAGRRTEDIKSKGREKAEEARRRADDIKMKGRQKMDEARSRATEVSEQMRAKASQTGEQLRQKASQTGEQVRQRAEQFTASASAYGRRAQQRFSQSGQSASQGFYRSLESNPLAIAGVVLAAGAAIGLMIPESRYEDEKLGPIRDDMLDSARETGREKLEQVEAVIREGKEAAKEEADRQGLVSKETSERAEQKARQTTQDMSSKARQTTQDISSKTSQATQDISSKVGQKTPGTGENI
jgi:hypothetical protein